MYMYMYMFVCVCVCVCVCLFVFPRVTATASDQIRMLAPIKRLFSFTNTPLIYHAASHPTRPQARSEETPINMDQLSWSMPPDRS